MAYVRDRFHLMDMATVRTVQMECNVDYDKAGNIVGIELFLPATAREETAMSDYTPTTHEVGFRYALGCDTVLPQTNRELRLAESDRWLAAHDAEVYQRGRKDAPTAMIHVGWWTLAKWVARALRAERKLAARGDGEQA